MKSTEINSRRDYLDFMRDNQREYKKRHPDKFKKGGKHYEHLAAIHKASSMRAHNARQSYQLWADNLILTKHKDDRIWKDAEIAELLGRSLKAIQTRRRFLKSNK